jgi:hypothetical protein
MPQFAAGQRITRWDSGGAPTNLDLETGVLMLRFNGPSVQFDDVPRTCPYPLPEESQEQQALVPADMTQIGTDLLRYVMHPQHVNNLVNLGLMK